MSHPIPHKVFNLATNDYQLKTSREMYTMFGEVKEDMVRSLSRGDLEGIHTVKDFVAANNYLYDPSSLFRLHPDQVRTALLTGYVKPMLSMKAGEEEVKLIAEQRMMELEAKNATALTFAQGVGARFPHFVQNHGLYRAAYEYLQKHGGDDDDVCIIDGHLHPVTMDCFKASKPEGMILRTQVTDEHLDLITSITSLRRLDLSTRFKRSYLTGVNLPLLVHLHNLTHLTLPSFERIDESSFLPIFYLVNLRYLRLSNVAIPDKCFHLLPNLRNLTHLILGEDTNDQRIESLPLSLTTLEMENSKIVHIPILPHLTSLNVNHCKKTHFDYSSTSKLTSLQARACDVSNLILHSDLTNIDMSYTKIKSLPEESKVKELFLQKTSLFREEYHKIARYIHLTRLCISHTNEDLSHLSLINLVNLTDLDLSHTNIGVKVIESILGLPLTQLILSHTNLTKSNILLLSEVYSLQKLYLDGIPDIDDEVLHQFNYLQFIDVSDAKHLTEEGVKISQIPVTCLPEEYIKYERKGTPP